MLAMSSWLSGSLAKAEQLLEKVDRSAGEKIEKVKERAGIQQRTGSADDLDEANDLSALLEKPRKRVPPGRGASSGSSPQGRSLTARPRSPQPH